MIVALRLSIVGRVQGVGFRAFVAWQAEAQGLRGWVRNRRAGSVEALLIGESDAVTSVTEQCGRGPTMARVDQLTKQPAEDDGTPDFTQRATV
jgi:acylphosphatase